MEMGQEKDVVHQQQARFSKSSYDVPSEPARVTPLPFRQ
jgi:hypothetical protein